MEITIYRNRMNRLYTEGELRINGLRISSTVESTEGMLPCGSYTVRIVKHSARKQSICIFDQADESINHKPNAINLHDTGWKIGLDHSWIGSKKNRIICIGTPVIPGSMHKGVKEYERIIDRLTKCKDRKEQITLIVSEAGCKETQPIKYWLEDSMHGCPPSKRHVEADSEGNCTIYDGDEQVNYIPVERLMRSTTQNP